MSIMIFQSANLENFSRRCPKDNCVCRRVRVWAVLLSKKVGMEIFMIKGPMQNITETCVMLLGLIVLNNTAQPGPHKNRIKNQGASGSATQ